MEFNIVTPVTTEPLTLAEVKEHLKLTSDTFDGDVTTVQTIVPNSYTAATVTGAAVDVLGYTAIVNLNVGTCGTVVAKIQESDNGTTWYDFTLFETITSANDNTVYEKAYTGIKKYIRVYAALTGTCQLSADVLKKTGDSTEDNLLSRLITAAREYCESFTRRAFATQTIEMYLDSFPSIKSIALPRPPLQSVTSVKYKDSDGTETTLTENTDYIVDTESDIGGIVLSYGRSWPSFTPYPLNPVKIRYVTGYDSENLMPKSIKQAMLLLIGHWYEQREAASSSVSKEIEFATRALLTTHKSGWF